VNFAQSCPSVGFGQVESRFSGFQLLVGWVDCAKGTNYSNSLLYFIQVSRTRNLDSLRCVDEPTVNGVVSCIIK